jgi:hypothetical protein
MKRKLLSLLLCLSLVISLTACGGATSTTDETASTSDVVEASENSIDELENNYMTSGNWAMYDSNYMFAVEVDDFNGDVFKAGKYKFKISASITKAASGNSPAVLPAIFDVYIGDEEYSSIEELKKSISEPQLSIGGMGSEGLEIEYELVQGQYVYIIPYDVDYEPSGYIDFEIVE